MAIFEICNMFYLVNKNIKIVTILDDKTKIKILLNNKKITVEEMKVEL